MERIPEEILDQPVSGVGLMPGSLRDQLGDEPTLLIFDQVPRVGALARSD